MSEEEYLGNNDEVAYETDVPILTVTAGDNEKGSVFRGCLNMRNEAAFCDVAFLVQGTLFRAHRVIVSSWSKWLFALLSEGPDQEIVSLDVFSPHEFGAILDYMYGDPLEFTVANAEPILKIVRRLEMRAVEQKCWRFLLSILNHDNCVHLHQIADFFECAPLKISAWRIIQESKPGYGATPNHMVSSMQVNARNARQGHGLTGPGEVETFSKSEKGKAPGYGHDDDSDDEEAEFSIFTATTPTGFGTNESVIPGEGLLSSVNKRYDHFVHPDKLPAGTPAAQVVKAWSFRLQEVFAECCDYSDINIAQHADMSALASTRSETESVQPSEVGSVHQQNHHQQEVHRHISAFSEAADQTESTPSRHSSVPTPVLSHPQASLNDSEVSWRPTHDLKSPGEKFDAIPEPSEEGGQYEGEYAENFEGSIHSSNSLVDWRSVLTDFYVANNLTEKIRGIDAILGAWQGRELDMMEVLHEKYKVPFDDQLREKLSRCA